MRRAFVFCLAVLLLPSRARAQDAAVVPALPAADAAPTTAPKDVRVRGSRRDIGGTTIGTDDAREIPATFGDPTRVVESLPGVVPTISGLSAFFVRGAPPETSGFFLDGVPVPALYHIGFGPAVVHPALLDHVDFFPGASPVRYGRAIGGILDAETRDPGPVPHGEATLRVFDAGGLVEAPFDGGRGSVLAAGRYAYPGLVLPLFDPNVSLTYWDYQARATWAITDRDRIGVLAFGSNDLLTEKDTNSAGVTYRSQDVATQFHRVDLRYDRAIGARDWLRLALTIGHDAAGGETTNVRDTSARLRSEIELRPSRAVLIRAGADVQLDHYAPGKNPEQPADPTPRPDGLPITPRNDVAFGLRVDVAWRIARGVELVPGLRADVFTSRRTDTPPPGSLDTTATAVPAIDPRLAARVTLARGVTSVSTVGVAHQVPGLVVPIPGASPLLQSPGVEQGLQTAMQISEGVEVALPAGFTAQSSVFLHHYTGLPDLTAPCLTNLDPTRCLEQRVDGRAFGLELLLRRALTERFTVWLSYTLSRATRQAHGPDASAPVTWIASDYDRTHVGSAMAAYDLGRGFRVGARVYAYSGRPYSQTYLGNPVPPYNDVRLPGFFRLDARIEKAWLFGGRRRISVIVEGLNVTLNKEVDAVNCQPAALTAGFPPYTGGPLPPGAHFDHCVNDSLGPITVPSIGLEGEF